MPARRSFTVPAVASTTTSRQLISLRRRAISSADGTDLSMSSSNFHSPFMAANVMSNAPSERRDMSSDSWMTSSVSGVTLTACLPAALLMRTMSLSGSPGRSQSVIRRSTRRISS